MQKLLLTLGAIFGLALVASGVFMLGREIGMEGRVTAQPEPLVQTPVQVAGQGGAGGMQIEPTQIFIIPTITPGPSPTAVNEREIQEIQDTVASLLDEPPESEEGCERIYVDATEEDVYIDFPFDSRVGFIPADGELNINFIAIITEGIGNSYNSGTLIDQNGDRHRYVAPVFHEIGYEFPVAAVPQGRHKLRLFDMVGFNQEDGFINIHVRDAANRNGRMFLYLCK